jgi:hypothetical protein
MNCCGISNSGNPARKSKRAPERSAEEFSSQIRHPGPLACQILPKRPMLAAWAP